METYTLKDENGAETLYNLVDVLEEDNKKYFALVPAGEESVSPVIMKETVKNGEKVLVAIEDEAEFKKIASVFAKRFEK